MLLGDKWLYASVIALLPGEEAAQVKQRGMLMPLLGIVSWPNFYNKGNILFHLLGM